MAENQNLAMRNMVSNETEDGSGSVSELLELMHVEKCSKFIGRDSLSSANVVVQSMRERKVWLKWETLYEAILKETVEFENKVSDRIRQLYKKENERKLSRQLKRGEESCCYQQDCLAKENSSLSLFVYQVILANMVFINEEILWGKKFQGNGAIITGQLMWGHSHICLIERLRPSTVNPGSKTQPNNRMQPPKFGVL
uniref:Uncharacterized protein n=1 Tax=Quercus lobata TaxID=97700 RepID=A0A7N2M2R6_QUELO